MIFAKNFEEITKKKIILGTSEAWSMSRLFHRPSEPVHCIVDCRIDCQTTGTKSLLS